MIFNEDYTDEELAKMVKREKLEELDKEYEVFDEEEGYETIRRCYEGV